MLWYFKPDKNRGWTDNLKEIIGFDTVSEACSERGPLPSFSGLVTRVPGSGAMSSLLF